MSSVGLSGLSGYDFNGLIDVDVTRYRRSVDKTIAQKEDLQTTKDSWRDVNTRLKALFDTLADISLPTTWNATKATSTDTNVVKATSGSGATVGSYSIHVNSLAKAQTVSSAKQAVADTTSATSLVGGKFSITVGTNTKEITVGANASLQSVADAINNAKIGVSASLVKVSDGGVSGYKLAINANQTGIANKATFTEVTGATLSELGVMIDDGTGTGTLKLNESTQATDASLTVNGITGITSATNTVTEAIQGVTLTLSAEHTNATDVTKIDVDENYAVAQGKIQAFVDQYNSTMSFIADKIKYDKTLKTSGDLMGDPVLQGIQARLRTMVTTKLNNPTAPYTILKDVGIGTSKDNFGKSATLSFDTARFNTVMEANPDSVAHLFGANTNGVTLSATKGSEQGLTNLLKNYLDPMVKYDGTLDTQQKAYDKRLTSLTKQIEAGEDRVEAYRERQTQKYARLETLLAQLDAQQKSVTNLFETMEAQTTKK